jgi:heavy metal sensor kinase
MSTFKPKSIRVRLTLWYAVALALIVLAYALFVYLFVQNRLIAELDRQLEEDFEAAEVILGTLKGPDGNRGATLHAERHDEAPPQRWVEVYAVDKSLLYQSKPDDQVALSAFDFTEGSSSESSLRSLAKPYNEGGTLYWIRVARPEETVHRELRQLLWVMLFGLPPVILIAGFGGYLLARRVLSPLERMSQQARQISAERLGERLPIENPADEFGQLAVVFNEAFARIQGSFEQLQRFTADASHELRTPLTALRSVGEIGIREARTPEAYREIISSMLEEADRLSRLVSGLLHLARAESGRVELSKKREDLNLVAVEVASMLSVLAEEKEQKLSVEGSSLFVQIDRLVLQQAVINLLDNAIKYSPRQAQITLRVERADQSAQLSIINTGPGISDEHQAHIFERFYRVDKGRSRSEGGFGLGLAIAKWAVEANGGRLTLASEQGKGSTFQMRFSLQDA